MKEEVEEKKGLKSFLRDCRSEFHKISWPSYKELVGSTWVVGIMIIMLSVFVLVCDQVLQKVLDLLTSIVK